MTSHFEGSLGENIREWPYPVNYGKEHEISTDALVLGGGLAGCTAVINAKKKGVNVTIVDKAPIIRSGSGGAGIDHWHDVFTNPSSGITPDEVMEIQAGQASGRGGFEHVSYITCKESYDALLDVEQMGLPIRDLDGEFECAPFRDEETKLLFAYDYKNKHTVRLRGGANLKVCMLQQEEFRQGHVHAADISEETLQLIQKQQQILKLTENR